MSNEGNIFGGRSVFRLVVSCVVRLGQSFRLAGRGVLFCWFCLGI